MKPILSPGYLLNVNIWQWELKLDILQNQRSKIQSDLLMTFDHVLDEYFVCLMNSYLGKKIIKIIFITMTSCFKLRQAQ